MPSSTHRRAGAELDGTAPETLYMAPSGVRRRRRPRPALNGGTRAWRWFQGRPWPSPSTAPGTEAPGLAAVRSAATIAAVIYNDSASAYHEAACSGRQPEPALQWVAGLPALIAATTGSTRWRGRRRACCCVVDRAVSSAALPASRRPGGVRLLPALAAGRSASHLTWLAAAVCPDYSRRTATFN
jgi:hypothetical protein